MPANVEGFEWDEYNVAHIAAHRVTPREVEETFSGPHIMETVAARQEERSRLFGVTGQGRGLVVVFTIKQNRIRPITAYDMNRTMRKKYAAQIGKAT